MFEIFGIWYGLVFCGMVWYSMLILYGSTNMQNLGILALKMTDLWLLEIFDMTWYLLIWYGMI